MFYAILPAEPPVFLVQPDTTALTDAARAELLADLGRHFMSPVSLVWWDAAGKFAAHGTACTEEQALEESLKWRKFSLPVKDETLPF